ncbi:hypothetical protein Goari_016829 [Gossypium aridum]|uniref:Uncharacterized protein n=1 Tax=Gossypium aridum TaxID=34290 RepID=A0A7J8WJX1_GOSAI|nr:hypothetical protein [Gossypium aridum]
MQYAFKLLLLPFKSANRWCWFSFIHLHLFSHIYILIYLHICYTCFELRLSYF